MIVIGNQNINSPLFVKIKNVEDIKKTQPLNIVVFDYDVKIAKYCSENDINYAVITDSITDAIFANALNCGFILTKHNALQLQELAQNYMFDTKVLAIIENDDEIEQIALNGIDGVIYKNKIKGL